MELRCTSLVLSALLLGSGAAFSQEPTPELLPLQNSDFEAGTPNWSIGDKMTTIIPEAARTGKSGMRVVDEDEKLGSSAFSSILPVAPGQGYKLTFWGKANTRGAASLSIWFRNGERQDLPEYRPYVFVNQGADWSKHELLVRAPETSASMRIWVHSFSGPKVTLELDDIMVEKASGPQVAALSVPVPNSAPPAARARKSPPYVILKLDDLGKSGNGRVNNRWTKVMDLAKERKIPVALGIICNSFEGNTEEYVKWLKEQHATGLVEYWNHGYDHKEWKEGEQQFWEFKNNSYEKQKAALVRSQELFKEKMGFSMTSFGAPFNATDANTIKALSEIPEITSWMYGDLQNPAGKVVLDRPSWLGIENPLFVPSLDRFIRPYNNLPNAEVLTIQGHPAQWDDARFAEFVKIIDFLTEQKAIFTTPSRYLAERKLTSVTAVAPLQTQPVAQTLVAKTGSLISNGDFSAPLPGSWLWAGKTKTAPSIIPAQIPGEPNHTKAWSVEVEAAPGANGWEAKLNSVPSSIAAAKDDMILMQFWGRSTPKNRVIAVYQQSKQPFNKAIREVVSLGPEWKKVTLYAPAKVAFNPGESTMELWLGSSTGKVELAGVQVENLGPITLAEAERRFGKRLIDYYGGETVNDNWIPAANARIEKFRKSDLKIRVTSADGKPIPGAKLELKQTRSFFRWGTAVAPTVLDQTPDGERYRAELKRNFNTAVVENELKWKASERNPAVQERGKKMVEWLKANDFALRGHTLVWGSNRFLPPRLNTLSAEELRKEIEQRVKTGVEAYKGQLYTWDVVNESATEFDLWDKVGWNYFSDTYKWAKAVDPNLQLTYNDYNIANESPDNGAQRHRVEQRIQKLLDDGAPLAYLGDQAHIFVPLTPVTRVNEIWNDWGQKFKLPIEITEFDVGIDDDQIHAKYVHDFLLMTFANPNVEAFLQWGFWEKAHWRGRTGAMFNADWTPRPAQKVYEDLVLNKWRTNAALTADKTGMAQIRAFQGEYDVVVTAGGKTQNAKVSLGKSGAELVIVLK